MSEKSNRIPASDPDIPEVGLGKFIDGFDCRQDPSPKIELACFILLSIVAACLMLICIGFIFTNIEDTRKCVDPQSYFRDIVPLYLFLLFILPSPFITILIIFGARLFLKFSRIFVYENGFVWETVRKSGRIIKQNKIDFREVDRIDLLKTRHYYYSRYLNTGIKLTVWSNGQKLLKKVGLYKDEYDKEENGVRVFLSLKAIIDQWTEIGMISIHEDLNKNGFVCFYDNWSNEIEIGKDYIKKKGVTIQKKDILYAFIDGALHIDDNKNNKKRSLFTKTDIKIVPNRVANNRLFLRTIKEILDIKFTEFDTSNSTYAVYY